MCVLIDCTAAGVSDTWILEEKRLREVQKGQLSKDVKRSHVVEDKRLHPYVPGPKAEERHRDVIDDWFLLLEPVSKISGKKRLSMLFESSFSLALRSYSCLFSLNIYCQ